MFHKPTCDSIERERDKKIGYNWGYGYWYLPHSQSDKFTIAFGSHSRIDSAEGRLWFFTNNQIVEGYMIPNSCIVNE
ncbi:MAG: hypothetical protein NTW25_06465 [Candidatus Kapabacteria bacterium]|nr:hypothetical protein [Candidatus Kapabacteria bacterium]